MVAIIARYQSTLNWKMHLNNKGAEMKQNIFDVLMYLFENYMNDDVEFDVDEDSLRSELQEAGFQLGQIAQAFDWLEGLTNYQGETLDPELSQKPSTRIYTSEECEKLDTNSRGFLMFLEQTGVLDHQTREMVIDRVMALDTDETDIEQLKWVVLMVLFNQPGFDGSISWMEELVFDEATGLLH